MKYQNQPISLEALKPKIQTEVAKDKKLQLPNTNTPPKLDDQKQDEIAAHLRMPQAAKYDTTKLPTVQDVSDQVYEQRRRQQQQIDTEHLQTRIGKVKQSPTQAACSLAKSIKTRRAVWHDVDGRKVLRYIDDESTQVIKPKIRVEREEEDSGFPII